jgi:tetratricopeptide (TPR) repeat protein
MKNRYFLLFLISAFMLTGLVNSQVKDKQKAQELYKKAIKLVDDEHKYDEAIELYKQAQEYDSETIIFSYEIAFTYYLKNDYRKAVETAEPLLEHKDVDAEVYRLIGNSYDMMGEKEKAIDAYKKGLEKFPGAGTLYHELGVVEINNKNSVEGIKYFEKGISVNPEYGTNYYELAKLFCNSSEKIWGILYGEIYMHIGPTTPKGDDLSSLLYKTYYFALDVMDPKKKSVSFSKSVTNQNLSTAPFTMNYEMGMALSIIDVDKITLKSLAKIRERFIKTWFEKGMDKKFPNALFDWQKEAVDKGYFKAYNYFIFRNGDEKEFNKWLDKNEESFVNFAKWFSKNQLELNTHNYFVRTNYSVNTSDSLAMNWVTEYDFIKDEPKVLNLIKWLEENPFYENKEFRKKAAGFVLAWFTKAPYIKMSINTNILYEKDEKAEGSGLVLTTYMNSKGAYLINNKDNPDEMKADIQGIKSAVKIYNQVLEQNPSAKMALMEKFKEMKTDEEIEAFITERLKQ